MEHFDKIYLLHNLLTAARIPVPRLKIEEELECSTSTVERLLAELRARGAPVEYDRSLNGYCYNTKNSSKYELPGLWFNASELYGLMASHQLLTEIEPGVLASHIEPLKQKITSLMDANKLPKGEIEKRVRIIQIANRKASPHYFRLLVSALLRRKNITVHYASRMESKKTIRQLSPQRLVHYRDNWYLDAWCHLRKELRTFSIDRIKKLTMSDTAANEIDDNILNEHYSSSYGIFSGKAEKNATLKFTPPYAQWVSNEKWHPKQNGYFEDQNYILEIPYNDPRELIQDILRFSANVEVVKPMSLREEIKHQAKKIVEKYK